MSGQGRLLDDSPPPPDGDGDRPFYPQERRRLGGLGILTDADLAALSGQRQKVARLMNDGEWHSAPEIRGAAGGSEGLRRMRDLRPLGVEIEKRCGGSRVWQYRLVRR